MNKAQKNVNCIFVAIPLFLAVCILCMILLQMFNVMYGQTETYSVQHAEQAVTIVYPDGITYPKDGIRPNTADMESLCELPGVGPVTAQAFHDELALNGPFFYPEDLLAVKGIGEKKLEKIRPLIHLP